MRHARTTFWLLVVMAVSATRAAAQDRANFVFQVDQSTQVGQSVFVLGDLPELGANDVRKAAKLEPSSYPTWKATVSLPSGRAFTYRYYLRNDAPGQGGNASNGTAVSGVLAGTALPAPPSATGKLVLARSTLAAPHVWWRDAGTPTAHVPVPMVRIGRGRTTVVGESLFAAWEIGTGGQPVANTREPHRRIEFFIANNLGTQRDPPSGQFTTTLDSSLVQDGNVFSYVPAASITTWRRDYNPASPPTIAAPELGGEVRRYRVLLPRGYDQHGTRRYPVLYMHDGQNVFEAGAFGSWNAHTTIGDLTRLGQQREIIVVGIDNGPNRLSDYAAPDAGGNAANYVGFIRNRLKPLIDTNFRTLTGADDTGAMGSSMGGQVSLYMGWDHAAAFRRIGALSGAWSVFTSGFYDRVRTSATKPSIRLYIDSGDAGTSSDNYWPTYNLRDALLAKAAPNRWFLEGDLRHVVGFGQQHNEAAWANRLPGAMTFLFPSHEAAVGGGDSELEALRTGAAFDIDDDGDADIDDLYAMVDSPIDVNLDGAADADDAGVLAEYLRRGEARAMGFGGARP